MTDHTASLAAADRRSLVHPFTRLDDYGAGRTPEPQIVTGGKGVMVRDSHGRDVIDGFSGLYCVNVGYGEERIIAAIAGQASKLAFFHAFAGATNEPAIALGAKLLALAGPAYARVFFGLSGSDANDTQVKLVWYYNNVRGLPHKKKVIARRRGYHGATVVTASLTGLDLYKQGFDTLDALFKHTIAADPFWRDEGESVDAFVRRCADDLDALIRAEGPDTVGAFIAEPMIGAGGIVPPPAGYWAAIQDVLRRHDVLLILDEVVTGFGRIGHMFAAPAWGIAPDLVTLAKGLTSAYLPLSAVLVGTRVWDVPRRARRSTGCSVMATGSGTCSRRARRSTGCSVMATPTPRIRCARRRRAPTSRSSRRMGCARARRPSVRISNARCGRASRGNRS